MVLSGTSRIVKARLHSSNIFSPSTSTYQTLRRVSLATIAPALAATRKMATRTPATTKAIVIAGKGKAEIREVPVPKVHGDWILAKVKAVGLNPTDWKTIHEGFAEEGTRSGCDYAGEVVEVGPKVTRDFKKGDRIAGWTHGGNRLNHETGTFGGYALVKQHLQLKIPDHISDEEAATLGISVTTVGQGLYQALKLPLPTAPAATPFPVLIYGGSTATGIYGIKYAKASGLTVLATSSPHNFDLLRSLGADAVFDYRSPTCGADIRAFAQGRLRYAWDCTGEGTAICAEALKPSDEDDEVAEKPKYAAIIPVEASLLKSVNPRAEGPTFTLAYDATGDDYGWATGHVAAKPADRDFAAGFWELSAELLRKGTVKPLKPEVNRGGAGGLEGVLAGLDELRTGKVSGSKLVYTL